jgi:hypothetical protein
LKQIIRFNKHQIYSIDFNTSSSINQFFVSFSFDSSFNRLEAITLYEPESYILISLVSLPHLFSLTLYIFDKSTDLTDIYRIVLTFPMLKYYKLVTDHSDLSASLPIATNQRFSPIEHLDIKNHCTFNDCLGIMSYTPKLNRLNYIHTNSIDTNIEINLPITLLNLTHLSIRVSEAKFDVFEIFMSKIHSKLKILSFTTDCEDLDYLDANRWEKFILKYLPQLQEFYLRYYASFGCDSEDRIYRGKPNQFISSFWIERQWILEVKDEPEEIIYSIRPYKYIEKRFFI